MGSALLFIFVVAIGYICGSFCSAIIVSRLFSLPDPRAEGSKNPGATNVLRLSGKRYAAIVLFGDMLKGLLPVVFAKLLGAGPTTLGFVCLAATIGHMYPVFFDFKGGKGVATALGTLTGLHFILGVLLIAVWLLVANFSRYSSLASIVTFCLAPIFTIGSTKSLDTFMPLMIMTIFILYQHRENITRLIDGEEPKIKFTRHQITDVADEVLSEPEPAEKITAVKKSAQKPQAKAAVKSPASAKKIKETESKPSKKPVKAKTATKIKKTTKKVEK